ncbi:MAG TPA: hypothetical protein VI078_02955 [bacterium]
MTRLIADTHLHLYPCYDFAAAISALATNLPRHGEGVRAGFFAERRDCHAFAAIREGSLALAPGPRSFRPLAEPGAVVLLESGVPAVYLFAGRQIVTSERIEVLALTVDLDIVEGLPAATVVDAVLEAGGVPVLGWSPGKWWFARGALIRSLLDGRRRGDILLGDTALRPAGAPEPSLMREARRRGIPVVAGTDPLPFAGEERLLGTYATVMEGPFDADRPLESARRLLRAGGPAPAGIRSSWPAAARRWLRNARGGRA